MKKQSAILARGCLSAVALVLSVATCQTALAGKLTQAQQAKIKIGMTADEVKQLLGSPTEINRVRYSPGPTYVYEVGDEGSVKHFEVDFDGSGKIMWISTHELPGR